MTTQVKLTTGTARRHADPPRRAALVRARPVLGDVALVAALNHEGDDYASSSSKLSGALAIARAIVGRCEAEDCVQEVTVYLLARRAYLRRVPDPGYFSVVRHAALRVHQYGWSRYVVAMDPDDLVIAEQMMAGRALAGVLAAERARAGADMTDDARLDAADAPRVLAVRGLVHLARGDAAVPRVRIQGDRSTRVCVGYWVVTAGPVARRSAT